MSKKGFTLIELLVVVSIIGLLASIVVVSLGGARSQGRDAKRQADIRQIQTAQELCVNDRICDNNAMNDYWNAGGTSWVTAPNTCATVLGNLVGTYMAEAPVDPGTFLYKCFASDTAFCVSAQLEQSGFPNPYIHARNTGIFTNQLAHCISPTG